MAKKHQEEVKDVWAENPNYPIRDWRYEVANDDTRLGYLAWVAHQEEEKANRRPPEIIKVNPRGWWYQDERNDNWYGPFDTPEEAEELCRAMAPDKSMFFNLINLQLWERRKVRVKRYQECPHCKGGFVGDRCCRKCDGTNRLEV
jgi:hypothetical protein